MTRRVIERQRQAAKRAPAPAPAPVIDYRLEFERVSAANARLQVRLAELERDLLLAKRTKPKQVPTALERAEAKLTAARIIADRVTKPAKAGHAAPKARAKAVAGAKAGRTARGV